MLSARNLTMGVSALGLAVVMASVGYAVDLTKAKLYPDKHGGRDFQSISKFCGTKPLKVALSDGWGGNYWRHITRAEFEDEASKCTNITETRYTDGEFKPEKQISDIEGLIAQKYDVIIAFLDTGPAILKATREATAAGVAVVPYSTGDNFPGMIGKDYRRSRHREPGQGRRAGRRVACQDAARQGQRHHVRRYAGQPDDGSANHRLAARLRQVSGHQGAGAEPVPTMWDPAVAQQKTAALIAKYPQIDGIYSETVGPIRAFVAAGKPIPAYAGQSLMDLSCLAAEHKMTMMSIDAHTWMARNALRKGLAAANGIDNTEPSLITLPISEDTTSTDPKLALKCDKSMPMDSIPSAMLSKEQQIKALGGK